MATNARCEPIYFDGKSKKIVLDDAPTELKKLPSENIDLILADPPYNIGKNFDGMVEPWNKGAFLAWLFKCVDECYRILKPHGIIYIINNAEDIPYIGLKRHQLFTIKSRIVWSHDSSGVQAKSYFDSMYEPILMMVKDQKDYMFSRDDILVKVKTGTKRALIGYRKNPPQPYNQRKVSSNVWEFPCVRYLMDEYGNHPTQKPKALFERITPAPPSSDNKALDPFAGGFTTGATAVELDRKFVKIEINTKYVKMGPRRLSIGSHFSEVEPAKVKKRKTRNLSKKNRLTAKSGDLSIK